MGCGIVAEHAVCAGEETDEPCDPVVGPASQVRCFEENEMSSMFGGEDTEDYEKDDETKEVEDT